MAVERLPVEAYERAELLLGHRRGELALGAEVRVGWVGDGGTLWYRLTTERGTEFLLADPCAGTTKPAFDHEALAVGLAQAADREVEPFRLPFRSIDIRDDGVRFRALEADWIWDPETATCRRDPKAPRFSLETMSPDGRCAAFADGDDLWIRVTATGEEFAVTTDGTPERGYARNPDRSPGATMQQLLGLPGAAAVVAWSPDSRRLLTHAIDESAVAMMHLVESAPRDGGRPRHHAFRFAAPGEPRATGEWLLVDVESRRSTPVGGEPFIFPYVSPIRVGRAWWSGDGRTVYLLESSRHAHRLTLAAVDAESGERHVLIEETGPTRVEAAPEPAQRAVMRVLDGGREALWFSHRDGWGHLYLYDLQTGKSVRRLTSGEIEVHAVAHVDEAERLAFLVVSGLSADPYLRTLVRVSLDGGAMSDLLGDDLDHEITASPDGTWFVDSASTVDRAPTTTVRDRAGDVVMTLAEADISRLEATGWTPPVRFQVTASDGVTQLYGVLHLPPGFDPAASYPVVDHLYPGPQVKRVSASFDPIWSGAESVAALGFVVLAFDGRGTPGRGKKFHDPSYRALGAAGGLDDHVAALHELARTRPWMDLDRVGVFGLSGGGFATVRAMLEFPETFSVGVAEAGNHDNRLYNATWTENYDDGPYGEDSADRLSSTHLAANLRGRLLLVHGEMDDNVPAVLTLRLVDRLIAAEKDFELLIVPGTEHSFAGRENYVTRRRWDFLVRHLLGVEPPEYRVAQIPVDADYVDFLTR